MTDTLREFLHEYDNMQYATKKGTEMHEKMRALRIVNGELIGDDEIVKNIQSRPEIAQFFTQNSRPEVPVAAMINGCFTSRRIDRMVVDDENHIVHIIDYKTDVTRDAFHQKYMAQVNEYISIIKKVYPKYRVFGYILWLHDWVLEKL